MADIWAFIEEENGKPSTMGLELVTKARALGEVTAVYVGAGSDAAFATLGEHGVSKVLHADPGDSLPAGPVAAALAALIGSQADPCCPMPRTSNSATMASPRPTRSWVAPNWPRPRLPGPVPTS
jgi:electron transfer flavoprotein alpha subunit